MIQTKIQRSFFSAMTFGFAIAIVGCASVHSGNYAKVEGVVPTKGSKVDVRKTESGLVVSGEEVRDMASKFFTQIDFTFENKSNKWIHIKSVKLDFGSKEADSKIALPIGMDLEAWASAAAQNKAISDYNFNLAMASIGAVGAGVAATSGGSRGQMGAGAFTLAGASAALTVNAVRNELNSLELAKVVPETHLLSSNFVVPPGLHSKKWVVLYTERPYDIPFIDSVVLEITTTEGKVDRLKLPFRTGFGKSIWQRDYPTEDGPRWNNYFEQKKKDYVYKQIPVDREKIRAEYVEELMRIE